MRDGSREVRRYRAEVPELALERARRKGRPYLERTTRGKAVRDLEDALRSYAPPLLRDGPQWLLFVSQLVKSGNHSRENIAPDGSGPWRIRTRIEYR